MSIASINPPPVALYREEQWFNRWVYLGFTLAGFLLVGGLWFWLGPNEFTIHRLRALANLDKPVAIVLGLSLPPVLLFGFLRMRTELGPTELKVWFGLLPAYRHVVSVGSIRSIEIVQYRPLRDYRGWGIRYGPGGELVLTASGDRALLLTFEDGSRLLVGTQRPSEFAGALEQAVRHLR